MLPLEPLRSAYYGDKYVAGFTRVSIKNLLIISIAFRSLNMPPVFAIITGNFRIKNNLYGVVWENIDITLPTISAWNKEEKTQNEKWKNPIMSVKTDIFTEKGAQLFCFQPKLPKFVQNWAKVRSFNFAADFGRIQSD
jgi:hypothetical protein